MSAMTQPATAFIGHRLLAAGPLVEVALAIKNLPATTSATVLAFDDASGRVIDFDLRGSKAEVIERLQQAPPAAMQSVRETRPDAAPATAEEPSRNGRGRPKLGVVAREVTLLPRHWEWLAAQPGGASVTLRKLIEEARRSGGAQQQARLAQEAAYRFMTALAGDFPGFEEATRALFADDRMRFTEHAAQWPVDVRDYAERLGFGGAG